MAVSVKYRHLQGALPPNPLIVGCLPLVPMGAEGTSPRPPLQPSTLVPYGICLWPCPSNKLCTLAVGSSEARLPF